MNKKIVYPFFLILVFFLFYFFVSAPKKSDNLVVFCDVGQGDGILIKKGTEEILVDAGRDNGQMMACLARYLDFSDKTIEKVIASHYDSDHIGGFKSIFAAYDVKAAYGLGPKAGKDTQTYVNWLNDLNHEGISEQVLASGMNLNFSDGYLEVLYPFYNTNYAGKNLSDVLKLHYLDKTFLLTGDLELADWEIIVDSKINLESDILKIAHHGSKNGTSQKVLDAVKPREAVISVGKNSYGHPAESVLKMLENSLILVHRIDQKGDVVFK